MGTTTFVYLMCALSCVIAYALCGIPCAYLVARRMGNLDVRTTGSGNVGSTNVARSVGKAAGGLTLLLDTAKAALAILIGYLLIGIVAAQSIDVVRPGGMYDWTMALVYLFCILGHVFTPYLHFKGGKGIAVGFGGALALIPLVGVSLLIPFLLFAVTTRYVSLGSIMAAISLPFWACLYYDPSIPFVVLLSVIAAFVVWAHRGNIKKLLTGTERKFSFKKRGETPESVQGPSNPASPKEPTQEEGGR